MKYCAILLLSALASLNALRGQSVTWSSEEFPIDETDLATLRPDSPDLNHLGAYRDAEGGLAVAAPSGAPSQDAKVIGAPVVGENKELVLNVNAVLTTPDGGWKAIFIGLANSSGHRAGIILNQDGLFFPARRTTEFIPLEKPKAYTLPSELRLRREGTRLTIMFGGAEIISINQPEGEEPYEIPVILASRQKPSDGVIGVISPARIE